MWPCTSSIGGIKYAVQDQVQPHAPFIRCSTQPYVICAGSCCSALIAYRYTYVLPHCRTMQYRMTFIPMSVSLFNELGGPIFNGLGLALGRFQEQGQ